MIQNKKLFGALLIIATIMLVSSCAKNNKQIPAEFTIRHGDYDFSLVQGGLTRVYRIHIPPAYDYKIETPMVIYLHGGGGSLRASKIDGMYEKSDKFGFILVSPAGTGVLRNRLLTWNGGQWDDGKDGTEACCGYAAEHNVDDIGFISQIIDEINKNFNIDDKRIYAAGISNGGLMAYRLACELSDKIAAVASIAPPGVPSNCKPQRPVPVMHIHGTADPCAPYKGGKSGGCLGAKKYKMQSAKKMIDMWLGINGCSFENEIAYKKGNATCVSYNNCKNGSEVKLCTVEGGGHTWPSGSQYLPIKKIGPVSYDISFDQVWDFFQKHPMN